MNSKTGQGFANSGEGLWDITVELRGCMADSLSKYWEGRKWSERGVATGTWAVDILSKWKCDEGVSERPYNQVVVVLVATR
jgi:hypothetical protein